MTGDTHNNGESGDVVRDVWDEDFVVEDLCDGDAVCQGGEGSVGSASFDEGSSARSGKSAAELEAEIHDAMGCSGALGAHASDSPSTSPAGLDAARDSFADALDAMIRADDDLAIDADAELDVINANSDAGSSAPEAFLLDDDDVSWAAKGAGAGSTEVASGEVAAGEGEDEAPDDLFGYVRVDDIGSPSAEAESDVSGTPFRSWFGGDEDAPRRDDAATVDATPVEERASGPVVERGEVPPAQAASAGRDLLGAAAVSEQWDAGEAEAGVAGAHGDCPPLGDHWARGDACDDSLEGLESCVKDGDESPVLIGGPGAHKRRWSGWLTVAAAASIVCCGAVVRMHWVGGPAMGDGPVVAVVELPRPAIALEITAPAPVLAAGLQSAPPAPPEESVEATTAPANIKPRQVQAASPQVAGAAPPAAKEADGATLPRTSRVDQVTAERARAPAANPMARFGEDLFVGDRLSRSPRNVGEKDADLAGARAFVQLHNGNYFVGRVKRIDADAVTLRTSAGELTITRVDVATLARIEGGDYAALQRAREGAVSLSSSGADVVVKLRSRDVRLPRAVVGEVATGKSGGVIRLHTTPEEDGWLRTVAERTVRSQGPRAAPAHGVQSGSDR